MDNKLVEKVARAILAADEADRDLLHMCGEPERAASDLATAALEASGLIAENARLREELLNIADGNYNDLAGNPMEWACMKARKALGLPCQGTEYREARAALQSDTATGEG